MRRTLLSAAVLSAGLAALVPLPLAAADRMPFSVAQRLEAAQLERPSGDGVALRN